MRLLTDCFANVKKDKKRINNHLRVVLADSLGKASVYNDVPTALVEDAFRYVVEE